MIAINLLEPKITRNQTELLLSDLTEIVGLENIKYSDADRALHSMSMGPVNNLCEIVLFPGSSTEIQKIVQLANLAKKEVWVFSRGNNWGYGTKNATKPGAIIMILERMNKIIEVNEELSYVVLEPGVSQDQLFKYLQKNHPNLWMDCTDSTPNGSVLGNALERGYGYTPYGDHYSKLCGLDIVLGSGEMFCTGGENSPTRYLHKWGSGPIIEGLFSQSNLGIVVKGGVLLMKKPDDHLVFTIDIQNQNLPEAIDRFRELLLEGTLDCHIHTANSFQVLSVIQKYPYELNDSGGKISVQNMNSLKAKFGIPDWSSFGALYGTKLQVKAKKKDLIRKLKGIGTLQFFDNKKIKSAKKLSDSILDPNTSWLKKNILNKIKSLMTNKDVSLVALLPEMAGVLRGEPTHEVIKSAYFKSNCVPKKTFNDPAKDGCGLMWCAPTIPASSQHVKNILKLEEHYHNNNFNMPACFTIMNARALFVLLGIFFDPKNVAESTRAQSLYDKLGADLKEKGYQRYRGGTQDWKSTSDGNKMASKLKMVFDPNNILSPDRYGSNLSKLKSN